MEDRLKYLEEQLAEYQKVLGKQAERCVTIIKYLDEQIEKLKEKKDALV